MEISNMNTALASIGFHGSYRPQDVVFLLNVDKIKPTDVQEKESLIQSGLVHYSQMISAESKPSIEHLKHYNEALEIGSERMATDIQMIGNSLIHRFKDQPVILVSLVRAGVPVGVLLKHYIGQSQPCFHYGISIIRDRGIDHSALTAIIQEHGAKNIVFVDGWTGKGAIGKELTSTLKDYPDLFDEGWDIPRLVTLADLGGCSWLSASCDDWLIPSGILGSVISGLTSRSILLDDVDLNAAVSDCMNTKLWHKCIIYNELAEYDLSVNFIEHILSFIKSKPTDQCATWTNKIRLQQKEICTDTIKWISDTYKVENINHIKPSIAEATRAVLRRVPERILVRNVADENVKLILHFAKEHNVPVDILGEKLGPYQAVTLIKWLKGK